MAEKEVNMKVNSPRSPEIGLWDSRSNMGDRMIPCSWWATYWWPYSLKIGPRGWSVTLPPLGSLSLLDRACELNSFDVFRTVFRISDRFALGDEFPASFLLGATCLLNAKC
ncbi:hypothetical protein PIB30_087791 [Stylosanthes scabra]|uniref:Uncharacterized protein n=1 Tax=Stylosanthes scabra TaxID=79078 RepID=A0ABU6XTQ1_9FABA|nr:hypothetical protein [Stylosanthes scabra]